MALAEYRKKRDFQRTGEPRGRKFASKPATGKAYLIQKHDASRLHYDLRLEYDGVLKSWAVPKGPSLDPADKSLAVQVEDHPLEYGSFEGTIPKGQYGGGSVMLWDRGRWEPIGDPGRGLEAGKLKFRLHGERLRGGWTLVRMRGPAGGGGKNWLLIKERDEEARPATDFDVREREQRSVVTGRSMEEIAAGTPAGGKTSSRVRAGSSPNVSSGRPTAHPKKFAGSKGRAIRIDPGDLPGARKGAVPDDLAPELALPVADAPKGDEWIHEIKFDGYRILAKIERGRARLQTRTGKDWTERFPSIATVVDGLGLESAVLDGEATALTAEGRSDFQSLQNAMKSAAPTNLVYFVFDLPFCKGFDLRRCTLLDRKMLLERILAAGSPSGPLRYSDHLPGSGGVVLDNACRLALEGIVSKRADSHYSGRRSGAWVKVKCSNRQEVVIGGYTAPKGKRSSFGALLVGVHDPRGALIYSGKVGTGYDERSLKAIHALLRPLETSKSPFKSRPRAAALRGIAWVRPRLVAEVEFSEWTRDGLLRHPAFLGLREDKPASEVIRESPRPLRSRGEAESAPRPDVTPAPSRRTRSANSAGDAEVAGVRLSNPGRVIYPEQNLTKLDLARYYESIAEWILPHVAGRPLTLVRCPQGLAGKCFYQKHATDDLPAAIRGVDIGGGEKYAMIDDAAGLVALVQMGVLEIHPWGCTESNLEHPDRMILDLDPGPGVVWPRVAAAAREARRRLRDAGLESFVKTSGGKGLHVVAPLDRSAGWDEVKAFARSIADGMAGDEPERYVATASKAKREGKIFIDYLRNAREATAVAAYSGRARAGAPVSTPLAWTEVTSKLDPASFSIETVPTRLQKRKQDPWTGIFDVSQAIPVSRPRRVRS